VRDLMDSFKSLPPPGYRRKIYIIDEVHMLSISAFNALLKSLEEPPPHTVFILATTDVHKIPETVISRCQRHDFRALSMATIEARLREVCDAEKIEADPESLKLVARMADGSMRDAQTLLDRVQSFCQGAITATETSRALGTVDQRILFELAQAIVARDTATVLSRAGDIFATGIDPSTLLREFVHFWREVFVAKLGGEGALIGLGLGKDASVELLRLVSSLEATDVQDLWDVARDGADRALRSAHPRYGFEALVARMATRQPVAEIGAIIGRLVSGGGGGEERKGTAPAPQRGVASTAPVQTAQRGPAVASRAPAAMPAAPVPAAAAVSAPMAAGSIAGSAGFVWEDIVAFASATTGRVLVENLKRLRPTRCEIGVFEAVGPEFTATSLMREKDKVIDIFNQYLDKQGTERPRGWKVVIQKGQGVVEVSATEKAQAKALGERELHGHPAVQSLQKIFPGSKVEQVRGKE
jgi:DNA polymerase-3 subunit gamma/tau